MTGAELGPQRRRGTVGHPPRRLRRDPPVLQAEQPLHRVDGQVAVQHHLPVGVEVVTATLPQHDVVAGDREGPYLRREFGRHRLGEVVPGGQGGRVEADLFPRLAEIEQRHRSQRVLDPVDAVLPAVERLPGGHQLIFVAALAELRTKIDERHRPADQEAAELALLDVAQVRGVDPAGLEIDQQLLEDRTARDQRDRDPQPRLPLELGGHRLEPAGVGVGEGPDLEVGVGIGLGGRRAGGGAERRQGRRAETGEYAPPGHATRTPPWDASITPAFPTGGAPGHVQFWRSAIYS